MSNSRRVFSSFSEAEWSKVANGTDLYLTTTCYQRTANRTWKQTILESARCLLTNLLRAEIFLRAVSWVFYPLEFFSSIHNACQQNNSRTAQGEDQLGWMLTDPWTKPWQNWLCDLLKLDRLKIEGCIKPSEFGEVRSSQLHHFSDASQYGYSTASNYARSIPTEKSAVVC